MGAQSSQPLRDLCYLDRNLIRQAILVEPPTRKHRGSNGSDRSRTYLQSIIIALPTSDQGRLGMVRGAAASAASALF
jgi:hypothetical protein